MNSVGDRLDEQEDFEIDAASNSYSKSMVEYEGTSALGCNLSFTTRCEFGGNMALV